MSFGNAWQKASKIEGWLLIEEARELHEIAKKGEKEGVIVEIGAWKGRSTICLALGSKAGRKDKVYSIDPHEDTIEHKSRKVQSTKTTFLKNLKELCVDDIVVPLIMTSKQAAKEWDENIKKPIRLLFIDGSHEYNEACFDVRFWEPHLIEGGILAVHDVVPSEPEIADFAKMVNDYTHNGFSNVQIIRRTLFAIKQKGSE